MPKRNTPAAPAPAATPPDRTAGATAAPKVRRAPVRSIPSDQVVSTAQTGPAAATERDGSRSKAVKATRAAKLSKVHRKPVRDSFTMPEADFAHVATLKARALAGGRAAKKSELLRAGLHALAALDTPALVAALNQLEPVKVGRPKSDR